MVPDVDSPSLRSATISRPFFFDAIAVVAAAVAAPLAVWSLARKVPEFATQEAVDAVLGVLLAARFVVVAGAIVTAFLVAVPGFHGTAGASPSWFLACRLTVMFRPRFAAVKATQTRGDLGRFHQCRRRLHAHESASERVAPLVNAVTYQASSIATPLPNARSATS